jgi:3-dehydroquinate synthase
VSAPSDTANRVIHAEIGAARFDVHLGAQLLGEVGALWAERAAGEGALVVSDANVAAHAAPVRASLERAGMRVTEVSVTPGEPSKSFAEVERICREAARAGLRRADAVVAIGGGVVGDLAGFVAASYLRGVRLVHVPTTLLAMVDSSIGGKTGIDLAEGKNLVGAIWQPDLVVMDTDTLATLPARQRSCGFAEIIKYGLLDGPELFAQVADWPADGDLTDLIARCVAHKLAVVAADERESGIRASLNLGHTVGHGIEAAGGYDRYHHGEAISLGLLAALRLATDTVGLDEAWRERTRDALARQGLPVTLDAAVATDDILTAMGRDKKNDGHSLNMVLVDGPGGVLLNQDPPLDAVRAAIEEVRTP